MKHKKQHFPVKDQKQQEKYVPSEIEPKWQAKWQQEKVYQPDLDTANTSESGTERKPFYNLMMFPYPSAEGLHVGNMYAFTGSDIYGRFKRMQGNDVFEPIGLDGFGIHSENYALKINSHPLELSKKSETNFYRQLAMIGNGFDWSRTVETYKPEYYRWTQWLFIQLFKAGLAYKKTAPVNFCPSCKTVLADEQVIDGKCERCSSLVEKRDLSQWFFKITKYTQRLLSNLNNINWSEKVKAAQRNWIGKSAGVVIEFELFDIPGQKDGKHKVSVFTTRPDTLFGVTFLAISPELAKTWLDVGWKANDEVKSYIEKALAKRGHDNEHDKTGIFSGIYAGNPVSGEKIPVWVADYVLSGYGTGAIMAVPAHDERDFEFAKKHKLPIKEVVNGGDVSKEAYTEEGSIVNSGEWDGWKTPESMGKVTHWLEEKAIAKAEMHYHLRDWLISRQRYWGPPIPMIYCENCAKAGKSWFTSRDPVSSFPPASVSLDDPSDQSVRAVGIPSTTTTPSIENSDWDHYGWYPVPEDDLPVKLPYVEEFKPLGTGVSPLASVKEFYEARCPGCGGSAKRETDVSDTFLDSSWYFFRYTSTEDQTKPFMPDRVKKWLPVTMYIGGAEHAVLHLLYARFITMVLFDLKLIDFDEPFARFYAHGLLIKDGAKMSKSRGNVIVPDSYIRKFGADTFRSYLMFIGPFSDGGDFKDAGIEGMHRFMKRAWKLMIAVKPIATQVSDQEKHMMYQTIQGVTMDIESLRFNTALAKLMTYYNYLADQKEVSQVSREVFLKLLAPFAPHMTDELWYRMGKKGSIHVASWPTFDEAALRDEKITILVQENVRVRDRLELTKKQSLDQVFVEKKARESEKLQRNLEGKQIKRVIFIPGKVINFITM